MSKLIGSLAGKKNPNDADIDHTQTPDPKQSGSDLSGLKVSELSPSGEFRSGSLVGKMGGTQYRQTETGGTASGSGPKRSAEEKTPYSGAVLRGTLLGAGPQKTDSDRPNVFSQPTDLGGTSSSNPKKRKKWLIPAAVAASLVVVALAAVLISSIGKRESSREGNDPSEVQTRVRKTTEEEYTHPVIETVDAKKYFEENATILDIVEIKEADSMLSEAEAYSLLRDRGFTEYAITAYLDADGNITDTVEISDTSASKHPMYETAFISSTGIYWNIIVISNTVMANPVSYNLQSTKATMTIFIENDYVTSFDNVSKQFFRTVPAESALITRRVNRISPDTLDNITMGEIDR